MKPYIAVMQATAGNRLAKYQDFDTQAEAQAHVDTHTTEYPAGFVHAVIAGAVGHWLIDMAAKTLTFSPDGIELDAQVKQAIRIEGMIRLQPFMKDADFEVAASIHLLYVRANGQAWSAPEQTMADQLGIKFTYVRDLYITAQQAIANIPALSETEKVNFNAASDVTWPDPV